MAFTTQHEQEEAFTHALKGLIKQKLDKLVEEETKKAQESIERQIKDDVDSIALMVLGHYTIERNAREIIIRVAKEFKQ